MLQAAGAGLWAVVVLTEGRGSGSNFVGKENEEEEKDSDRSKQQGDRQELITFFLTGIY